MLRRHLSIITTLTMSLTFESLACEIRHEIYSYLLLGQNVAYANAGMSGASAYGFKFEIALFRVNKFISADCLQFFHSRNAFIVVKSDREAVVAHYRRAIPMLIPTHFSTVEFPALKIEFASIKIDETPNQLAALLQPPPRQPIHQTRSTTLAARTRQPSTSAAVPIGCRLIHELEYHRPQGPKITIFPARYFAGFVLLLDDFAKLRQRLRYS